MGGQILYERKIIIIIIQYKSHTVIRLLEVIRSGEVSATVVSIFVSVVIVVVIVQFVLTCE